MQHCVAARLPWMAGALILAVVSLAAARAEADTKTWTGAVNNLWSVSGNWAGGAPAAGDRLVFPSSAANKTNSNDLPAGTVFFDITFLGGSYVLNGNAIGLSNGIPASTGSGNVVNAPLAISAATSLQGASCCAGLTLAGAIDIGANAVTISGATVSGVISGTGAVTLGDVTTLSGANTYNGQTTITGRGCIEGAQASSSVVASGSGARFCGNGVTGAATVSSSGRILPGSSLGNGIGVLTVNGLQFNTGTVYEPQINGIVPGTSHDQIVVNGGVTLSGSVQLSAQINYTPTLGQQIVLIDNDGADAVSGTFTGLPEGSTLTSNASEYQISYAGGTGNDVVLTVTAAAKTWSGGASGLWSNGANWVGGVAPGAGDPLVFPSSAANKTNSNDLPAGTVYRQILFTGGSYVLNGNAIGLSHGIPASTGSGNVVNAPLAISAATSLQGASCCAGLTLAGAIDIGANAVTISGATVSGVISGTGAVTLGDVTTLSGANTYNGQTTITGRGCIEGAQASSSVVASGSGARFCGNGVTGAATVSSSGRILPGSSLGNGIGVLTVNGLQFNTGTVYEPQINGIVPGTSHDQIVVNGGVTLSGSVQLSAQINYTPTLGQQILLIDNDGADAVSGTFTGLPEGATLTSNASEYQISYAGGTGNDVVLTVTAAAKTWSGGASGLWSNGANWVGGVAPGAGDPLVFPSSAANKTNSNDLPAGTVYRQILFTGGSYVLNGNAIGLSHGIPASTGSGNVVNAPLAISAATSLQGASCCAGLTLAGAIDIGANAVTISGATVSGVISGTGAVTLGDVTTLSGANTYVGQTTITGRGCIEGAQASSSVVASGSSARFCGNGVTGAASLGSNAQLRPGSGLGDAVGELGTGSLTFNSGTSYVAQLNGSLPGIGYDQVNVVGGVALNGTVSLSLTLGFTPARGQIFVLVGNDGSDAVSGIFAGRPQGTIFNLGPYPFEISYIGKTGNEIIVTSLSGDPLNAAPVALDDGYATNQDTTLHVPAAGVLQNDSDSDMHALSVVLAPSTTQQGGSVSVAPDGSFSYTPPSGYSGPDTFTYIISDGHDATDLATVTIDVQAPATATPTSTPTHTDTPEPSATPTEEPTLTPTATASATETPTATAEATATATATETPTPSATPAAGNCGDGVIGAGEQCDDGNQVSGDACPSAPGDDCLYTGSGALVRGHHRRPDTDRRACQAEWYVVNPNQPPDRHGLPARIQRCADQDPSCDFDATPGTCRFRVVVCLNNVDPNLPLCTPQGIASVEARAPERPSLTGVRAAVENAATHLLDPANPSAGHTASPPLSPAQQNLCSAPFSIDVSLDGRRRRSVPIRLRSRSATPPQRVNRSRLRLTCVEP